MEDNGKVVTKKKQEIQNYIDTWWGHSVFELTEEDIEALQKGNSILFNNNEYSTEIRLLKNKSRGQSND